LTCRKSATWGKRLYFLSEGRHAEDFFARKNPTASAESEPAILGTRFEHANHWITEATLDDGTGRLFRNVSKELLLLTEFDVHGSVHYVHQETTCHDHTILKHIHLHTYHHTNITRGNHSTSTHIH
jgi:hypothetical protein